MWHKTVILGNLGKDPEAFGSGDTARCRFSVAVNEKWKGGEHTEWYRVVVFGKQAGPCLEYLSKGSMVLVEGTMRTREHKEKYYTDLRAARVQFLDKKKDATRGAASKDTWDEESSDVPADDDLEFGL